MSSSDDIVDSLKRAGEIESRYAAIVPKGINSTYLKWAIESEYPRFFRAKNQGINMAFPDLLTLEVPIHNTKAALEEMAAALEEALEQERLEIERLKELKKTMLSKMFV